jgi:hypothetical protein
MSEFKFKPDKIKYLTTIDTLDSKHKKEINELQKKRNNEPKKKKRLEMKQKELLILDSNKSDIDNYISIRSQLLDEINDLADELCELENYEHELEYYSKTHQILFNYYDIIDGQKTVNANIINTINNINNNINNNNNNINNNINLCYDSINESNIDNNTDNNDTYTTKNEWEKENVEVFNKSQHPDKLDILNQLSKMKRKEKKITRKRVKNTESLVRDSDNIFNYLNPINTTTDNKTSEIDANKKITNDNNLSKFDRASLFEDYKTLLDGYQTQKKINKPCINCGPSVNKVLIYAEGIYACLVCGEVEKCIIENEITNYKDPMIEKPSFPYKRKNHFCEWIFKLSTTAHKSRY